MKIEELYYSCEVPAEGDIVSVKLELLDSLTYEKYNIDHTLLSLIKQTELFRVQNTTYYMFKRSCLLVQRCSFDSKDAFDPRLFTFCLPACFFELKTTAP